MTLVQLFFLSLFSPEQNLLLLISQSKTSVKMAGEKTVAWILLTTITLLSEMNHSPRTLCTAYEILRRWSVG